MERDDECRQQRAMRKRALLFPAGDFHWSMPLPRVCAWALRKAPLLERVHWSPPWARVRGGLPRFFAPMAPNAADTARTFSDRFVNLLHACGLLAIPAGARVIRFLPPLNLRQAEAEEGLQIVESVVAKLAG